MNITYYPTEDIVKSAMQQDDPLLAIISFDGAAAAIAPIDDAVEHHILIKKSGLPANIDEFFESLSIRKAQTGHSSVPAIINRFQISEGDLPAFYKDGFALITELLSEIGYFVDVTIPKRYRRHFDELM